MDQLNILRTAPPPRALPRIQAVQETEHDATHRRIPDDDDDFSTEPQAIEEKVASPCTEEDDGGGKPLAIEEDVIEPRKRAGSRFRILESDDDDDDDGAIKPSAMVATKRSAQHQPMCNRTNVDYFASMVSASSPQKKKWKKFKSDFWKEYGSDDDDDSDDE